MAAADLPFRRPRPAEARLPVAPDRPGYGPAAFRAGRLSASLRCGVGPAFRNACRLPRIPLMMRFTPRWLVARTAAVALLVCAFSTHHEVRCHDGTFKIGRASGRERV